MSPSNDLLPHAAGRRTPDFPKRFVQACVVLVLLTATAVADDELTSEACLACHGTPGFASPADRPLYVSGDAYTASVHASLPCTACHSDATEIPHAEALKRVDLDTCGACHTDEVTTYRQSIHGQANGHGVQEAATCTDCHGNIHAVTPHTERTSAAHWSNLAATCARCHARVDLAEKFHISVVRPVEAYLESAHARAVAAGKRGAVCSDCHGAHGITPSSDPRSPVWRSNVPQTCAQCHGEIAAAYAQSVHGEALARGAREAPVCTDCHGEHRILSHTEAASPVFAANIPAETCGRCHANERLNQKYGLAAGKVSTFQDSYHGLALRAGKLTVANCSSCHGVHDIRRSSDPLSHVNAANLPRTCGQCHPGAGTQFVLGSVHVLTTAPTSTTTWIVYRVRVLYLWLIAVTVGLMASHNLLDLSRKARGGTRLANAVPMAQPERMGRGLRWQHGLVMVSFPVLVYSGFALKYPESWWAAPLLGWETSLGLRGLIHRVTAVTLIVSLAWHVVHLAVSRRLRACLRGLWWSRRDLHDVGAVLAYYVHQRPTRPHTGQFSYIEKAEYWAFLWGTFVMSLTGLMLWFENTTLRYLPKWTADVATTVHFYEAILATLSILVWHLYWVIFDPDVYPMDWSWWDGRPPAVRVLERMEPDPAQTEDES